MRSSIDSFYSTSRLQLHEREYALFLTLIPVINRTTHHRYGGILEWLAFGLLNCVSRFGGLFDRLSVVNPLFSCKYQNEFRALFFF
jgi:hypothetical protein